MQGMYIQIGQRREHDFHEPLGLLQDCHRRIERFLGALQRVAEAGGPLGPAERHALEASLRYFREAAPHHTQDEEVSLFPRLRASADPRARTALARLGQLEADHVRAGALHAETEALFDRWLAEGTLPAEESARLRERMAELAGLYAAHIALEDAEVFPLAGEVLAPEELSALGREMASRRNLGS